MERYKIAGLIVDIEVRCNRLYENGKKYLCNETGPADIAFIISDEELNELYKGYEYMPLDEFAYMVSGSAFYHRVVQFQAMMLHSSAVAVDGRGYCFSAHSGTGKSTHAGLWKKYLGQERVQIINDDKPLIRLIDGKYYVCGTPWSGKTDLNQNICVPLKAITFIKRGTENSIVPLDPSATVFRFYQQTVKPKNEKLMAGMLATADKILTTVPLFELTCDMSEQAVQTSFGTLSKLP